MYFRLDIARSKITTRAIDISILEQEHFHPRENFTQTVMSTDFKSEAISEKEA